MGEKESTVMRRLWLVRHGATEWNSERRYCGHSDVPLAALGCEQASWLARRLRSEEISLIYSSDLARARQTAEILARGQQVRIEVSSAWREINFGAWEGLTYAQIVERFGPQQDFFTGSLNVSPPGGESLAELVQRVQTAYVEMTRNAKGDIVLVSHGGPLRALLCCILSMPLERQWQLRLDPGSVSAIDFLSATDEAMPGATLALLNMQHSLCTGT